MKATGIVRRIDDLGRVVIPKEMRIREGDPLEIYTDSEGEVIFKKYSPIGEMSHFAVQYAEVLHRTCGFPAAVSDRDHIVAVSGVSKKDVLDRRVSDDLEALMEKRQTYLCQKADGNSLTASPGFERALAVAVPILSAGDVTGCVMLFLPETMQMPGDTELKLAQAAASFLGKQMEE